MYYKELLEQTIAYAAEAGVAVKFVSPEDMPKSPRPTPVRGAFRMGGALLSENDPEDALFILLHGLGHMAQWTLFPKEHEASYYFNGRSDAWDGPTRASIWSHERGALLFVLGFLREHGLMGLRDWYVHRFIADQNYLVGIYRSGRYGLHIFQRELEKKHARLLRGIVEEAAFPPLNLADQKEGYICFI